MSDASLPELLEGHRYIRLTTFRKSGEAVSTPVWFELVGDKAYVFTSANSGKAKRIRNNSRVVVTPSNFRGRPKVQGSIEAEARLMNEDEEEMPNRVIDEKYGWQYRLFNFVIGLPRNPPEHVFLELRSAGDPG
ncbi:MAG: PPOX class F420-dependent oxidoreductase [Rubrobacteraceae bacterium]|nr:PPOX class F420-dependent oxidoreductase [Rubrobacteraceae bacterium]